MRGSRAASTTSSVAMLDEVSDVKLREGELVLGVQGIFVVPSEQGEVQR